MKTIISLALLGTVLAAAPAFAQDAAGRSQAIGYADLDLGSAAGRSELDRRIALAVRNICGTASDTHLKGKNNVRRCIKMTKEHLDGQRESAIAAASESSSTRLASQD